MGIAAKALEAMGIACVMIGLVQGIMSETMWAELYLSVIGIVLFLIGWGMEKSVARRVKAGSRE
jgi:membrane-bound ClpP family serine protease